MKPNLQNNELFCIKNDDQFYLYNPLNRSVSVVNEEVIHIINLFFDNGYNKLSNPQVEIIKKLFETGILSKGLPNYPLPPKTYCFFPTEVTLFITTRCNLRCIYCYANGGSQKIIDISFDACKSAIDFVAKNAVSSGLEKFVVSFHGGGEPFCSWHLLKECVFYAKEIAKQHDIEVELYSATNGMLSHKKLQFIVENLTAINISADGPPEIQDFQRPFEDGSGSSTQLFRTIEYLETANFPYDIRITVTKESSPRIIEIVRYFGNICPSIQQLHIEPAWYCGRCHTSGIKPPSAQQFVDDYIKALSIAKECGIKLYYSGARLDSLSNRFCSAPGEGFSITPYGNVTSCFEVIHPNDPRSEFFHYGYFDKSSKTYIFDKEKMALLRKFSVDHLMYCSDCFCRWHCAGDCLAKSVDFSSELNHKGSERCEINRSLTFFQIKDIVKQKKENMNKKRKIYE